MTTLSKAIIYKDDDAVERAIEFAKLDEIDEYGYTPLVQTAIVNSLSKARLLLKADADVNYSDLGGRTALHWASENNNAKFCEVLLDFGADPNALTRTNMPVLVMPFQFGYDNIKHLLKQAGASLTVTKDYINAKIIGHAFELSGRVDFVDHTGTFQEMELEGYFPQHAIAFVLQSLRDFRKNFAGKELSDYFTELEIITQMIARAGELLRYQNYLIDYQTYSKHIDALLNERPQLIPVCYSGHSIYFVRYGQLLVRCDRGAYGKKNGTVIVYQMQNAKSFSTGFIKQLLYKRQSKAFIEDGIIQYLGLKPIHTLPISEQKAGNCTWANLEATIPATIFLLLLNKQGTQIKTEMRRALADAGQIFKLWREWDSMRSLHFCMESFKSANPARKASKAALLAAVLFQHFDFDYPLHREKGEAILEQVLMKPDYRYILRAYIDVFSKEYREQPLLKNLYYFLDHCDIDPKQL